MALCLANSLVAKSGYTPYDQLVRYKWWYQDGYMSSTGKCFDIGQATSQSLNEFERRQNQFIKERQISSEDMDYVVDEKLLKDFNVYCSEQGVAGNGALMRLAPVPLFFYRHPEYAVEYSGRSGQITHGDTKAYDACRYYGALIVAALLGYSKDQLLDKQFYSKHKQWFGGKPLCKEIEAIAEGSFKKKGGYKDGIRGKGYIVNALEAALWAFWSDDNLFEKGALAAVNLGDDTDTTAAIYGQLAGAYYGYKNLPQKWIKHVYAKKFMLKLSKWIVYEGQKWTPSETIVPFNPVSSSQLQTDEMITGTSASEPNSYVHPSHNGDFLPVNIMSEHYETTAAEANQNQKLRATQSAASSEHSAVPLMLPIKSGPSNRNRMDSHATYQRPSDETITSSIKSPPINESTTLYNSALYTDKTSEGYDQSRTLRSTISVPPKSGFTSLTTTADNQRSVQQNDTNSKVVDGIDAAEKKRKASRKVTDASGYTSQNLELVHPSTTNKPRDTKLSKPDRQQPDPRSAYPGYSVKQSNGTFPAPTASRSHYPSSPTADNYTSQSPSTNKVKKHSFTSNSSNMSSNISPPQNEPITVTHGSISRGTNSRASEPYNDKYNQQKSYF